MVAGRGGVKKDGRKLSALEELFGSTSDSEASTFHGFEDAELEDILFSDDESADGSWEEDFLTSWTFLHYKSFSEKMFFILVEHRKTLKAQTGLQWLTLRALLPEKSLDLF